MKARPLWSVKIDLTDIRWWDEALVVLAKHRESTDSLRFAALPALHPPARLPIISILTNH